MLKPTTKTRTYYEWSVVEKAVQKATGKNVRDWKGKFTGSKHNPNVEYCDFWHVICDLGDMHNGAISFLDFEDIAKGHDEPWIKEVCTAFIEQVGPGEHEFLFEW